MDRLTEIKAELNNLYQEYKDNKNQLNGSKTKSVSRLIIDMISLKDFSFHDVAMELARFSADVTKLFFETLAKSKVSSDVIDNILKEMSATDNDARLSQYYVQKYVFAITVIMANYKDDALKSSLIPQLVVFIANFAVKSDKNKNRFYNLINNTKGGIFKLDYSGVKKNSLLNIWKAISNIYPDLSKAQYQTFIMEWGKKYGFVNDDTAEKAHIITEYKKDKKKTSVTENRTVINTSGISEHNKTENKMGMSEEQENIINAVTALITPVSKAINSIQGEISKSRETGIENVTLKVKVEDLKHQLSEQREKMQNINQSLMSAKSENDNLKKQITILESKNSELDNKLNNAYSINSRESSLEAEKIRSELKKAFAFLYEDWLEYEFSDVSEENYESLQAIIKKIFRSLERTGINFKGNN